MARILITGATGYLGSRLARRLVASQEHDVAALVRPSSDTAHLKAVPIQVLTSEGGVTELAELMDDFQPDVVVHMASLFLSQHSSQDVGPLIDSNIKFGVMILEAMVQVGIMRLLNTGTSWEEMDGPPDYRPVCLYAATKRAFENLLAYYEDAHGLKALTLRLFDTYGPGDPRPKLFSLLQRSIGAAAPIAFSPGEQVLDLTHVDDVTAAFERAIHYLLAKPFPRHEALAIGSGKGMRLRDVVALYEEVGRVKTNIAWGERPYRPREVMNAVADPEPAAQLLGWRARIPLREGLQHAFFGV